LLTRLTAFQNAFVQAYGAKTTATNRNHCFVFADWDSVPKAERQLNIRLDENYTQYAPSWTQDKVGRLNGSGIPMHFTATDRSLIDVYQVVSDFDYEYFSGAHQTYNYMRSAFATLLDTATAAPGYWGIFGTHYDYSSSNEMTAILDEITARNAAAASSADQIAMVSAQQVLDWLDLRNGSSFDHVAYDNATSKLTFGITVNGGINNAGLEGMLPATVGSRNLTSITRSGASVAIKRTMSVRGVSYAFFEAVSDGQYVAVYQ
jgi:hypothetical protein